ncbi:MAG: putative oxidoreductase C-terminal domain-containing protein [Pseudomonadota bacterium]
MSSTSETVLAFLDPGHFHAALTLKFDNPRVARDVYAYASPGPDLDAFVALIDAFNSRAEAPTRWRLHVHTSAEPEAALIADAKRAAKSESAPWAVVLAGRNNVKLARIDALHQAGIPVLADKPWLTDPNTLHHLASAMSGPPLARDIMTSRYDPIARLRLAIAVRTDLFGTFAATRDGTGLPAIEIGSRHHLLKLVNGEPLARPPWYFDVGIQGTGLVDIQSHMTDQAGWLAAAVGAVTEPCDFARDVQRMQVERWTTPVPLELFTACTGLDTFPGSLAPHVEDGTLALQCNSVIRYEIGGISVQQRAEWGQREPAGSGDVMSCVLRGTRCEVVLEHGAHTDWEMQLHVRPVGGVSLESPLAAAVADWQTDWPGLEAVPAGEGFRLDIPAALQSGHEQHFAMVLDQFLKDLGSARHDVVEASRIQMRYTLLAHAERLAGEIQ